MGDEIEQLRNVLESARRLVIFTGAGISTESGIPDFRSPGGFWSRQAPIDFDDFLASEEAREETWRRRIALEPVLRDARPNPGHHAVAGLIAQGRASTVITQNIDGLHQASGVPEEQVVELHGNTTYARCLSCGGACEIERMFVAFERTGRAPRCDACDGYMKSASISFGQPMPAEAMRRAEQETLAADVFLVLGSSLVVYPAAGFPVLAKENGARLVIVNREPTRLDRVADLVLHRAIGEAMGAAVAG